MNRRKIDFIGTGKGGEALMKEGKGGGAPKKKNGLCRS